MTRLSYLGHTANQARETPQTRSQQAKSAWLRDNDVGVTARNLGGTVKETLTGVDRQLHGHAVGVKPLKRPAQRAAESVVMRAVGKGNQCPRRGTAEAAVEDNAVGYAVVAISRDGEAATRGESATILQIAAGQGAGTQGDRAQVACNQSPAVETIYGN